MRQRYDSLSWILCGNSQKYRQRILSEQIRVLEAQIRGAKSTRIHLQGNLDEDEVMVALRD
jgi:hypothetical protein